MSKKNHRQSAAPYAKGYSEAGASVTRRALKGFTPDSGSPNEDKKNAAIDYAAFVMQLARPLVHDEKTYTELTFNFEDLSGNDSLAIERELQMLGHTVIVANFDSEYLIRVCVKACTEKLGLDALGKLSIRDFNRLRNTVRGFLSRKE